jgi:hypothetical protein
MRRKGLWVAGSVWLSPDISPACPEQVKSVIVYVKAGGYHFGAAHGA